MKIAIITAISGGKDLLEEPPKHDSVDYYAFTDAFKANSLWIQKPLIEFTTDSKYKNRRNAKIYKILPELFIPNYDYYFWVDGTHDVIKDPKEIINTYLNDAQLGVFIHTTRNCAYKEAEELINLNYDHHENIINQIQRYQNEGFPKNYGLYELPVLIRKNSEETTKFNLMWWEQICKYSSRDQVSFPYCLWKTNIRITTLPGFANGINPNTGTIGNNNLIPQRRHHKN